MTRREAEFLERLRATFRVEAADHLQAIAAALLGLERAVAPADAAAPLEVAFRHTHSLKGAARAAGFPDIESVCQLTEEVFALCRRSGVVPAPAQFDELHRAFDLLRGWMDADGEVRPERPSDQVAPTLRRLRALVQEFPGGQDPRADRHAAAAPAPRPVLEVAPAPAAERFAAERTETVAPKPSGEQVRVSARGLDRLLMAAGELLAVRQAGVENNRELRRLGTALDDWGKRWQAIQAPMRRVRGLAAAGDAAAGQSLLQMLEFVDWSHGYVRSLEVRLRALAGSAARDGHLAARQIDDLLDESRGLLMTSFEAATEGLPRLARDLGREQGKQVELRIGSDGVQLDRRIVDALKDPLVHLVRNAVDHGVESPAERRDAGKPLRATIRIEARMSHGNHALVEIADDGKGMDPDGLRQAAVRAGLFEAAAAADLDEAAALELAFRSDISTSAIITEISGRGLGLAIARDHVERLGGRITMESVLGQGVRFRILLPQSLATLRGLFVEAGGQRFLIPTAQVRRVASFRQEALRTVGRRRTLSLAGATVAVSSLSDLLGLPARTTARGDDPLTFVVLGTDRDELAVVVDEVLEDEDVLVRRLRRPLLRVRNVAGATLLPSGKVVPILDVGDLLKTASGDTPPDSPPRAAVPPVLARAVKVLLAEDSITSRLLLKGILEGAGCEVKTAADGIEAHTALRSEAFDLLVSDIEMPRLNGFDLTARIRADPTLAALPVVLVTALARREDRERGIDVGANAYIAKGGFDQRELLEAIRRLVPGARA